MAFSGVWSEKFRRKYTREIGFLFATVWHMFFLDEGFELVGHKIGQAICGILGILPFSVLLSV